MIGRSRPGACRYLVDRTRGVDPRGRCAPCGNPASGLRRPVPVLRLLCALCASFFSVPQDRSRRTRTTRNPASCPSFTLDGCSAEVEQPATRKTRGPKWTIVNPRTSTTPNPAPYPSFTLDGCSAEVEQPATRNPQPVTRNAQPATRNSYATPNRRNT